MVIDMTMADRVTKRTELAEKKKKSPTWEEVDYEDCSFEEFLGITKVFCFMCGGILCTLGIVALLLHYMGA